MMLVKASSVRTRGAVAALMSVALCLVGSQAGLSPARADTAPPAGIPATVSSDALPTWQINGVVWSTVVVGNTVYATGKFTKARPPGTAVGSSKEVTRANLLAFDITTGNLITTFNHSLNGQGLRVVASPDKSRVYVGGDFTTVDGRAHKHLAAFSTSTGALISSFAPQVSAQVRAIAATNTRVYFGGNFFSVNGSARTRLAAVSASTGATISTWKPKADDNFVTAMVLAPDGSRVIVGGHFTKLNGVGAYGMGALDASTGATLSWAANAKIRDAGTSGAITSLTADSSQIYGAGYAFGSGSNFEGTFAAKPIGGQIVWLNDCHGDTYDAFAVGQVVYSVSHAHDCSAISQFPETNPRTWHHALAFTTYATGTNKGPDSYGWNYNGVPDSTLLHWYPTLTIGTYTGQNQAAWSVTATSKYVVLGGEFRTVEGKAQQGLTRFAISSIAPNKTRPIASGWAVPTAVALSGGLVRLTWKATWDHDNNGLTYQVLRDGGSTPIYTSGTVKSSFWIKPTVTFTDSGLAPGSTHTYRVRAVDPFGNTLTGPVSSPVTASAAALSAYSNAVLNDGAADYWPLDETNGTTAYDYAAPRDLTLGSGATRNRAGALAGDTSSGASLTFTGTPGGTAASRAAPTPGNFTVEAWVKTSSTSGGKIIGYGSSSAGRSASYDRHLYVTDSGRVGFGVNDRLQHALTSMAAINDGQWHHVVGTLDATDGMKLYVDGALVAADPEVTAGGRFSGFWRIGGDNLARWPWRPSSDYLNGSIDEIAVYPVALSASQIDAHYRLAATAVDIGFGLTAASS